MACQILVFVFTASERPFLTYPPETIEFDASRIPLAIANSLEEAIKCHAAEAYRAAALMIRRVLEEVCEDKSITGKNLMERIKQLGSASLIPAELLDSADELRLLGNDAAHIEAKSYDQIGKQESEIAIEMTKEILKSVYQYSDLVTRLRALKKAPKP